MTQQKDYYTTAKATPDSLLVGERKREREQELSTLSTANPNSVSS
jgi:hypothetical protein